MAFYGPLLPGQADGSGGIPSGAAPSWNAATNQLEWFKAEPTNPAPAPAPAQQQSQPTSTPVASSQGPAKDWSYHPPPPPAPKTSSFSGMLDTSPEWQANIAAQHTAEAAAKGSGGAPAGGGTPAGPSGGSLGNPTSGGGAPDVGGGEGWQVTGPQSLNPNLGKYLPRASMQALAGLGTAY